MLHLNIYFDRTRKETHKRMEDNEAWEKIEGEAPRGGAFYDRDWAPNAS